MNDKIGILRASQVSLLWHIMYTTATIAITGCTIYYSVQMSLLGLDSKLSSISQEIINTKDQRTLILQKYDKKVEDFEKSDDRQGKEIVELRDNVVEIHKQLALILQKIGL